MVSFLLKILGLYFCLLVFLYFYQRNLQYFPDTSVPDARQWNATKYEDISVTTQDGLTLKCWYFPPKEKSKPVIILFHGNGGHFAHRTFKANIFQAEGYCVLLAEYRGYGGNPGSPTEQGLYHDARAYINWLGVTKQIPSQNIVLYGESLGSGVAVHMATEYDVAGVILESAFYSAVSIAQKTYFFVPAYFLMKDQFRSDQKIQNVKAPILFVHGEKDSVIPIQSGKLLYDEANDPKTFIAIPEADHNDLYNFSAPLHVLEFLSKLENVSDASATSPKE